MYLSLYCKGSKRLFKVLWWEGVGDRTELQYIDPHSYGLQRCVFLVLQRLLNRRPRGPLCWFSLLHLISNFSGPQLIRGSKSPLDLVWHSLPNLDSITRLISVLTELYNSSTPTQSPTQSLEWHVWSSSSGNNCHAVQRSLSSGASLCSGTVGPSPCPILSAELTCAISFDYWPLGCVTSFRCITLKWHDWPGRRSKYNINLSTAICHCNDATQLYTKEMCRRLQIYKIRVKK